MGKSVKPGVVLARITEAGERGVLFDPHSLLLKWKMDGDCQCLARVVGDLREAGRVEFSTRDVGDGKRKTYVVATCGTV